MNWMKQIGLVAVCLLLLEGAVAQKIAEYKPLHDNGQRLATEGNYKEAIDLYNQSIDRMPYHLAVYEDRAKAQMQQGAYIKALRDWTHVIQRDDQRSQPFLNRAICLYQLERFDEAEEDLNTALRLRPDLKNAQVYKAALARANVREEVIAEAARMDAQATDEQRRQRRRNTAADATYNWLPFVLWSAFVIGAW